MGMIARACSILGLSLALVGCSANFHTAYRLKTLPAGESAVITMDAKQRSILSTLGRDKDGKIDPTAARNFCSEPSPDVFSVIAQSLSAGGSFGKNADPASIQAALNLAYSSAEQGSTIPRTQTINMLRELMFNTCLRYINGGIDKEQLAIQAVRDQRLMVSILAIEQLTGAVTPKPVVISASGSGGAGISGEAIIRLDDARKAKESAETLFQAAESAYQKKNGDKKVCDALKGKKDDDPTLTAEQKVDLKPCDDARKARDEALGAQTRTAASYQELSTLARSGGVTVATKVEAKADGGLDRASIENIGNVVKAVTTIVAANMSDDTEVMLYCLPQLKAAPDSPIGLICSEYVKAKVNRAAEEQNKAAGMLAKIRKTSEYQAKRSAIDQERAEAFEAFWNAHGRQIEDKSARKSFVTSLQMMSPRLSREDETCFARATVRGEALVCFSDLTDQEQEAITSIPN